MEITFPEVAERDGRRVLLTLSVAGKEVFRDVKAVSVLPRARPKGLAGLAAGELFVYDPQGSTEAFLKANGIPYTSLENLSPPPVAGKVWIVGKDALTSAQSTSGVFSAYAASGGRVLLLEQQNPLRYQGLNPAEIDAETNLGRVGFCRRPQPPDPSRAERQGLLHLGAWRDRLSQRLRKTSPGCEVACAVQRVARQ